MLLVDFEKAFDSIEWSLMYDALNKFNFGNEFIKWVKLLYTNISSCLVNNGISTRSSISFSIWLSIYHSLELLAETIRQDKSIKGIKFGSSEIKLIQYVDDMTIFVADHQ